MFGSFTADWLNHGHLEYKDGKVKTAVKNAPIDFYFGHNFSKNERIDFISFAM